MAPKDILDVEWRASETLGHFHDIRWRHEQKHGAWIDEATNEPGTRDPVDLRTSAGHPHSSTLTDQPEGAWTREPMEAPLASMLRNPPSSTSAGIPLSRSHAATPWLRLAPSWQITTAGWLPGISLEISSFSKVQCREEGMRYGSASNSSSARTSINVGHFGVPIRRTSFSTEIVFGAGIMRPLLF